MKNSLQSSLPHIHVLPFCNPCSKIFIIFGSCIMLLLASRSHGSGVIKFHFQVIWHSSRC
jgi:hypothetical protein